MMEEAYTCAGTFQSHLLCQLQTSDRHHHGPRLLPSHLNLARTFYFYKIKRKQQGCTGSAWTHGPNLLTAEPQTSFAARVYGPSSFLFQFLISALNGSSMTDSGWHRGQTWVVVAAAGRGSVFPQTSFSAAFSEHVSSGQLHTSVPQSRQTPVAWPLAEEGQSSSGSSSAGF